MFNKITGIMLLSLCALNLTAADTSADEQLANRLYSISSTFKGFIDQWNWHDKQVDLLKEYQKGKYTESGIFEIIKNAQDETPEALQAATQQYLSAIADPQKRKNAPLALLRAANFFDIEPIMQTAAQGVADYLKTPEALAQFNNNPEQFMEQLALASELQERVSAALLEPFKAQLTTETASKSLRYAGAQNLTYSPKGDQLAFLSISGSTVELWNLITGDLSSFPVASNDNPSTRFCERNSKIA